MIRSPKSENMLGPGRLASRQSIQEMKLKRSADEKSKEQNGSRRSRSRKGYRCSLSRTEVHSVGFIMSARLFKCPCQEYIVDRSGGVPPGFVVSVKFEAIQTSRSRRDGSIGRSNGQVERTGRSRQAWAISVPGFGGWKAGCKLASEVW